MLKILISFCLVASALCVCPRFASVTNLNLPEFAGTWHIHGVIRTFGSSLKAQCLQLDINSNRWNVAPVLVDVYLNGQETVGNETIRVHEEYPSQIPTLVRPGRWTVDVNNGTQWEYSILHTDYLENSLSVACHHNVAEDIDEMTVLFKSRYTRPMPDIIIQNYLSMLSPDYQIDSGLCTEINQGDFLCKESRANS